MSFEAYAPIHRDGAALLGRKRELTTILQRISKPTGDHLSIVGAPYIGKTTLLRHIARVVGPSNGGYITAALLDLRYSTPTTDHEFRMRLLEEVHNALKVVGNEAAEYIDPAKVGEGLPEILSGIFDLIKETGRILVVMDGLDYVLKSSTISRNLWDYLREIGLKSSCTFLTGTRSRIRELCNNPDSMASEFWNIFADPVIVLKPFGEVDKDDVLAPLDNWSSSLERSGRKEIFNWSGGHPALTSLLCNQLMEYHSQSSPITGEVVIGIAQSILSGDFNLPKYLWDECSVEVRGDLHDLASNTSGSGSIPSERLEFLRNRGFIGNSRRPKLTCRLIEKMALKHGGQAVEIKRMFSTEQLYSQNVQRILELRLSQVSGGDRELRRRVERVIRELGFNATDAIASVRMVACRALDAIWEAELEKNEVPQAWKEAWKFAEGLGAYALQTYSRFPRGDAGRQCGLLCDIVGGRDGKLPVLAKYVTRPTYVLVEHIKRAGDDGQHIRSTPSLTYAAAICIACIKMYVQLTKELP